MSSLTRSLWSSSSMRMLGVKFNNQHIQQMPHTTFFTLFQNSIFCEISKLVCLHFGQYISSHPIQCMFVIAWLWIFLVGILLIYWPYKSRCVYRERTGEEQLLLGDLANSQLGHCDENDYCRVHLGYTFLFWSEMDAPLPSFYFFPSSLLALLV